MLTSIVSRLHDPSSIRKLLQLLALNTTATAAILAIFVNTEVTSVLILGAIPILASGWAFGRKSAFLSASILFVLDSIFFALFMKGNPSCPSMIPGFLSYLLYGGIAFTLRTARDMNGKINELNAKLLEKNKELLDYSLNDPLTRLNNRRYAKEFVSQMAATFLRQLTTPEVAMRSFVPGDKVYLILMAELEEYQAIVQTHGQEAADQALVETSRRIQDAVRFDDMTMRWEGARFLVVCPLVKRDSIRLVVRKILDGIRSDPVQIFENTRTTASLAIGAVGMPFMRHSPYAVTFEHAIRLAETALKCAMKSGNGQARLMTARESIAIESGHCMPDSVNEFVLDPNCYEFAAIP